MAVSRKFKFLLNHHDLGFPRARRGIDHTAQTTRPSRDHNEMIRPGIEEYCHTPAGRSWQFAHELRHPGVSIAASQILLGSHRIPFDVHSGNGESVYLRLSDIPYPPRKPNPGMKRFLLKSTGWLVGLVVLVLRMTCRIEIHNDPRPSLSSRGGRHVFALLHAQQVAASMAADRGTGAMVSRSADGEIIVPALRVGGHVPIRGSSGKAKGGAAALQVLIEHVRGNRPAILAVDGPRGPRGSVQKGIGLLARKTDAAVLAVIAIPTRRWIITRTWDRLQIPKPFSTIHCYFAEPALPRRGESLDQFAKRIETSLAALEKRFDPGQADTETVSGDAQVADADVGVEDSELRAAA